MSSFAAEKTLEIGSSHTEIDLIKQVTSKYMRRVNSSGVE